MKDCNGRAGAGEWRGEKWLGERDAELAVAAALGDGPDYDLDIAAEVREAVEQRRSETPRNCPLKRAESRG